MNKKVGFGGGCHWCTEAVFAILKGVEKAEQGFIQSAWPFNSFSEAVIVTYNSATITLNDLIEIHLHTHAATSMHNMRNKYRSAVYFFNDEEKIEIEAILKLQQQQFDDPLITKLLPFINFKTSPTQFLNYYSTDPQKPFCKLYIHPKLEFLKKKYNRLVNPLLPAKAIV